MSSLSSEIVSVKDKVVECRDTLKQILIDKKIEGLENENSLSLLISRVSELEELKEEIWLYKDGDEFTDITGGYTYDGGTKFTKYPTYIEQKLSVAGWVTIRPTKNIDFTPYKCLCIEYYASQTRTEASPYHNCLLRILNSSDSVVSTLELPRAATTNISRIDLENVNITGKFSLSFSISSGNTAILRLHKAWLEK